MRRILSDMLRIVSRDRTGASASLCHRLAALPFIAATRLHLALLIPHLQFTPRHLELTLRHLELTLRHLAFVICHLAFVICHLAFAIRLFPIPHYKIRIPQFPKRFQRSYQLSVPGRLVPPTLRKQLLGHPIAMPGVWGSFALHRVLPREEFMGSPQGAPISPLLSNIYMRRFVKGWKTGGRERRLDARIVNYADDFVICCRGTAEEAMTVMRRMMSKLKLTVNETKTRLCRLPEETFDFLGYTLGRNYDRRTGASYLGPRPARKKIGRLCGEIGELTTRGKTSLEIDTQIGRINRKLRGWSNYFCIGPVSQAYRSIDSHVRYRVRRWLCAKFKVEKSQGKTRYPDDYLRKQLKLHQLQTT